MADVPPPPSPPRTYSSLRLVVSTAAIVLVFMVASAVAVVWLAAEPNETQVIEEWNATIAKLGIDPVFPPEEDVAVGDIYAVLDDRENGQPSRTALALRSIKLDHMDLTDNLNKAYAKSYQFPATTPRPKDADAPWDQTANQQGIMSHPDKLVTLPLAAFPGFTIRQTQSYRGGLLGWLSTAFGFESDDGVELNIPVAETYGIPSIEAVGELEQFCTDKNDPNRCTDETLRRHLAFVTSRAFELKPTGGSNDPKPSGEARSHESPYRYRLEVVLVNRVYLARYIDQRFHNSRAAQSRIGRSLKEEGKSAPADSAAAGKADLAKSSNEAGVKLESDNSQTLKQTFLRPIAIGYRAVRRLPDPNLIDPRTDTNTVKLSASVSGKVQACFNGGECSKENLASAPPVAINATQAAGSAQVDENDAKRYRIYLHTANQPKPIATKITDALAKSGYTIQGAEDDADTVGGAGVDYFNDGDGGGAANVAKIVSGALSTPQEQSRPLPAVTPRRQKVYNPIGVLGIWLPPARTD